MQASITISFNYSDNDNVDPAAMLPPDPKWLQITVKGKHVITQIFLPTLPLKSLTNVNWDGWIATIQGPIMGCCSISATQCRLLLDIALIYHVFTSGTAAVPDIWYTNFIRTLINIACTHPNNTIDSALVYLTSTLHVLLPRAIFDLPDILPVTHDPEPPISTPLRNVGGSAPAPPTCASSEPPTCASSETAGAAPEFDGMLIASLDEVYSAVPRRSVNEDCGSDSETLPSLCTVYGSSNSND